MPIRWSTCAPCFQIWMKRSSPRRCVRDKAGWTQVRWDRRTRACADAVIHDLLQESDPEYRKSIETRRAAREARLARAQAEREQRLAENPWAPPPALPPRQQQWDPAQLTYQARVPRARAAYPKPQPQPTRAWPGPEEARQWSENFNRVTDGACTAGCQADRSGARKVWCSASLF